MHTEHDITELLAAWRMGDGDALDRLLPIVYAELKRIARRQRGGRRGGDTLTTTALVHETWLRLANHSGADWVDRAHFFAVAARAMRYLLIDHARRHQAAKRGGGWQRLKLDVDLDIVPEGAVADERAETLLALDDALTRLAALDERACRVVECRFFGGLTDRETAEALGVTERTVQRDWTKAKGWLRQALSEGDA
jgi:RNA polymerase sigma factor (TIGR02999 family)